MSAVIFELDSRLAVTTCRSWASNSCGWRGAVSVGLLAAQRGLLTGSAGELIGAGGRGNWQWLGSEG